MTVQELIYLLEAQPDNNAVVNLGILTTNRPGYTFSETYSTRLYVRPHYDGSVLITNYDED